MEELVMNIPTLYGDHHTTAVRKILEGLPGICEIYVSSAFQQVSLAFDPDKVDKETIEQALADQGYRSNAPQTAYPISIGERTTRHTAAHSGTGEALSFAELAPSWEGRPLWPCPGFEYRPPALPDRE